MWRKTIMTKEEIEVAELAKQTAEETAKAEAEKQAEEKSVYQLELEKLTQERDNAEAARIKAEEIAKQKTGAITEEREKRKAAEAAAKALSESHISDEDLERKLDEKINNRLANEKFSQLLSQTTSDVDEQALIKLHYEKSIIKTGNVETDLARAAAIANSHLLNQAKQAQIEREASEARTVSFQSGSPKGRQGKPAFETDPTKRKAADLLERLGVGDAKKYL